MGHEGPVYIRINRNPIPVVTRQDEPFRIGVPSVVRDGGDATVFANGYMVYKAIGRRTNSNSRAFPCGSSMSAR